MAFSNLFIKLCGVDKDVKDSCESESSYGKEIKMGKGAHARKRKAQGEPSGSYLKKQCFHPSAAGTFNAVQKEESRATDKHRPKRTGKDAGGGFFSGVAHQEKTVFSHDQSYKNTNYTNKKKKKKKGKKKQTNAYHNKTYKGGRWKNEERKQPPKRFMTQEFKDQHALEVDGRLICIYHLRGTCIKGDECQLEHIQGYNNLIKEVCKFYVQGFCVKGETCPYMHQSYPCKFFHKKGNCNRDDCKFSHDPLNELTEKLLDEAMKRENEFLELNKKLEQESLGQPENVQMSEAVKEKESVDITVQPVRSTFYNFYKSSDTNEEKETLCRNEQSVNITEENPSSDTEHNVQPEHSMSKDSNQTGPVCYSVEAVLGPQLSKPFFYTTPGSPESALSVPKTTAALSFNHFKAPYSVTDVLRSKSDNTARHLCTLPVSQSLAATSKRKYLDNLTLLSDVNPQKVSYSGGNFNAPKKLQEKPFKRPPSQQLSESYKTKDLKESVPNPTPMDKTDTSESVSGNLPPLSNIYSVHNSHTPMHPVKEKLNKSESLIRQSSPVFKDKTTDSSKPSDNNRSVGKTNQAASVHQNLPETKCGRSQDTRPSRSNQNVAEERKGSVLSGNSETPKRPFQNLFTSLVPDSVQLLNVGNTFTPRAQCLQRTHCAKTSQKVECRPHQATTESSPKTELCADNVPVCSDTSKKHQESVSSASSNSKSEIIKGAVEPDETPAKLFRSLFAAPLAESSQTNDFRSVDDDAPLSDLHRSDPIDSRASSSETKKTESVSQTVDITHEHRKDTLCSTTSEPSTEMSESPSTSQTLQHLHKDSSHKAGPPNSVLRTLFHRLGPYEQQESHQDRTQISVHPESEKDSSSRKCLTAKQQRKRIEKPERNVEAAALSPNKQADVPLPLPHTSLQTPDVHFTANRIPSSPCAPGTVSVPQTRTDNPEPQSQVTKAEPPTEKTPANEITAGTSLRDLFKSLVPIKQ